MEEIKIKRVENRLALAPRKLMQMEELVLKKAGRNLQEVAKEKQRELAARLIKRCQSCPLYLDTKGPVPPTGPVKPRMVIIGRNPGKGDDMYSKPFSTEFSGGRLFQKYLRILGLQEGEVYVSNMCLCTTKQNRPPTPTQLLTCSEWKTVELSMMEIPPYIMLLGNDALRFIMGSYYPAVERIYGDLYLTKIKDKDTLVLPVQHPGFLLRNPEEVENTMTLLETIAKIIHNPAQYNMTLPPI